MSSPDLHEPNRRQTRPLFRDAIAFWERGRVFYNLVLAVIVAAVWGAEILAAGPNSWLGALMVLSVFACAANLLYCGAYPVDLACRLFCSDTIHRKIRWSLFVAGVLIAVALELWIMFRPGMA